MLLMLSLAHDVYAGLFTIDGKRIGPYPHDLDGKDKEGSAIVAFSLLINVNPVLRGVAENKLNHTEN